jgi:hypothetical protein
VCSKSHPHPNLLSVLIKQFATFVDPTCAALFHSTALAQGVVVKGFRLRVGWGTRDTREDAVSTFNKKNATRNVYVGGIKDFETFTEEKLRNDFSVYGEVEMINFLKEKAAAFVNLYVAFYVEC